MTCVSAILSGEGITASLSDNTIGFLHFSEAGASVLFTFGIYVDFVTTADILGGRVDPCYVNLLSEDDVGSPSA